MNQLKRCVVLTIGLCAIALATVNCWVLDLFRYTPYDNVEAYTAITYYGPESYGTAPPTIKMQTKIYTGNVVNQSDIDTWLTNNPNSGGYSGDNGVHSDLFTDGLAHFGGFSPEYGVYDAGQTCNGGKSCDKQGVADVEAALSDHRPVALKVYGSLYGIANEWGGSRLCATLRGCQPSMDFWLLQVPASGHGQNIFMLADNFSSVWKTSNTAVSEAWFYPSYYLSVSNDDWDDFDNTAATYYGDPDPPDPTYSEEEAGGGGGDAPPIFSPVRLFEAPSAAAARATRAARTSRLVVPNPTRRDDILVDFVSAVKRTHLNRVKGLESLSLDDRKWAVSTIAPVRSLDDRPDYFLLTLTDRMTRQPVAQATVSSSGLLLAARRVHPDEAPFAVSTPDQAATLLRERFGVNAEPELAFSSGDLGLTEFEPFYMTAGQPGKALLVTPAGKTFEVSMATTSSATPRIVLGGKHMTVLAATEIGKR